MTEDFAHSVIRLMAVVAIMVGLCMAAYLTLGFFGTSVAMADAPQEIQMQMSGAVSQMGMFSVFAALSVSGVGFALFALSGKLAAKVVEPDA